MTITYLQIHFTTMKKTNFMRPFALGYSMRYKERKIAATSDNGGEKPGENPLEGDKIFEEYYYESAYQQLHDDCLQAHFESSYEQLDAGERLRFEQTYPNIHKLISAERNRRDRLFYLNLIIWRDSVISEARLHSQSKHQERADKYFLDSEEEDDYDAYRQDLQNKMFKYLLPRVVCMILFLPFIYFVLRVLFRLIK